MGTSAIMRNHKGQFQKGSTEWVGKKHSIKSRKKMRETKFGKKRKPFSKETKQKISIAQKGRKTPWNTGENCNFWKGGISKERSHYWRERRNRKLNALGNHNLGEWENLKAQYNFTCPCCKIQEPKIKLTEDHIIPLSKGGSDNIENIQPLCRSCNSRKQTKIIKYGKLTNQII